MKRRGIARAWSELVRYRDEIDRDNRRQSAQSKNHGDDRTAGARLLAWSYRLPEAQKVRRKTDAQKQRLYEQLWLVAEALVECHQSVNRHSEQEAAWLAAEAVLDRVAPALKAEASVRKKNIWAGQSRPAA